MAASSPPREVIDALAKLSHTVSCLEDCFATVGIRYSEVIDGIVIVHADPECGCVRHTDGDAARELAEYVMAELERLVVTTFSQYGDLPVSVGATA